MWRIVTFSFTGKGTYAGTFAIEVDNSGVPITNPKSNCNFVSISGDAVDECTYTSGIVSFLNKSNSSAGVLSNFASAVEGQTYTEQEPAGTWSYTNGGDYALLIDGGDKIANCTISPTLPIFLSSGASQTITVTPDSGYVIDTFVVDGIEEELVNNTYTFTNVQSNHVIGVVADLPRYTITASAGTGCTISPSGTVSVTEGHSQNFEMTANTGFQIASVLVDGTDVGAVSNYTFSNVQSDHTISVSATALPFYHITKYAGPGGNISGANSVYAGGSSTYTITPFNGCEISSVLVDGVESISELVNNTYTFTNVQADHIISVYFVPVYVTIYNRTIKFDFVEKNGNKTGTVTFLSYNNGLPVSPLTITDYTGFEINSISYNDREDILQLASASGIKTTIIGFCNNYSTAVEGQTYTESGDIPGTWSYTLGSTTTTYTIVPSAGANGSISPNDPVLVEAGTDQTFTITPDEGYYITSVLVDNVERISELVDNTYTFTNVNDVHTIGATFGDEPPTPPAPFRGYGFNRTNMIDTDYLNEVFIKRN